MEQQGLNVIKLQDEGAGGQTIPLAEIDPFTFLASFNRGVTEDKRRENWEFLKARWGLAAAVPADFAGIPTVIPLASWLFPYAREREKEHVRLLWQIATQAADEGIAGLDAELFNRCLKLKRVAIGSLTIGLFWINPEKFLPADHKTTAFGKAKGTATEPEDYESYRQWMEEMARRMGRKYPEISHDAHMFAIQGRSWAFTKWLGPVLDALRALGGAGTRKTVQQQIQQTLKLPDTVLAEKNKSGVPKFRNEIDWARQYLVWEALIESPVRGQWVLTEKGKETVLDEQDAQAIAEKWTTLHRQSVEGASGDDVVHPPEEEDDGSLHEAPSQHQSRRYWTLSVGAGGEHWDEFYSKGIAAIGWEGTGDLRQFKTKDALRQKLQELMPGGSSKVMDTHACWQFVHDIGNGDIIFAKRGFTRLLGCGVVEGDYDFDATRTHCKHVRKVKWMAKGEWEMPKESKMASKTLTDITPYPDFVKLVARKVGLELVAEPKPEVVKPPLPSGVAYWWLNANPRIWDFGALPVGGRETYTSHNDKGNKRRIYQHFLEVKPGDIVVGYVGQPHKEVVAVCRITRELHQTENGEEIEFEKEEQLAVPIPYEALQATPDVVQSEPFTNNLQGSLFRLTEQEYEVIRSLIDEKNIQGKTKIEPYDERKAMEGLFLAQTQFDEMLTALKERKNVVLQGAPGVGKTYVAKRLAYALVGSNDPQRIEMIQFHQSYSYEDFIQGFRPAPKGHFDLKYGIFHQFCRRAQRGEGQPFVFIIDEINRGNLSKIFGELMMLIEPDKRGKDHAIPLAYSQDADERFYIPEDLHLIGTMNTADRSLAMVDYALRRRFRFITLRPEFASEAFREFLADAGAKPELVKKIVARMNALNEVIAADTKNLGPGYQVGHSYFCPRTGIKADDDWYRRVIESEIVPLLQEYWFDNEQKVKEQRSALLA
jgi:5-methylcytosine-specific restriction protein B